MNICLCTSHRCADGTVKLPLDETQPSKFASCQTLNNHCKADKALYEDTKNEGLQSDNSKAAQLKGMLMI